jgi:hypothetical protein
VRKNIRIEAVVAEDQRLKLFSFFFQLDGPKAGQTIKDDEPDFYDQAQGTYG